MGIDARSPLRYTVSRADSVLADRQVEPCRPGRIQFFFIGVGRLKGHRLSQTYIFFPDTAGSGAAWVSAEGLSYPPKRGVLEVPFSLLDIKHLLEYAVYRRSFCAA